MPSFFAVGDQMDLRIPQINGVDDIRDFAGDQLVGILVGIAFMDRGDGAFGINLANAFGENLNLGVAGGIGQCNGFGGWCW